MNASGADAKGMFAEATRLSEPEHAAYLDQTCASNPALRQDVDTGTNSRNAFGNWPPHGPTTGLGVVGALGALKEYVGSLTTDGSSDPSLVSAAATVSNLMTQPQADLIAEMLRASGDHRQTQTPNAKVQKCSQGPNSPDGAQKP